MKDENKANQKEIWMGNHATEHVNINYNCNNILASF